MTVSSTTNRKEYTGNGATTSFSFPYPVLLAADLEVYKNGTLQTLTTHYTLSGTAPYTSGTNVQFVTAPANNDAIVILRDPAITQLTDLVENDPLPAETLEQAYDLLTMIAQRLSDRADRALSLPETEQSIPSTVVPSKTARQGRMLMFNEITGAVEVTDFTETQVASAVAAAYAGSTGLLDALSFVQAGTGADSRSAQAKAREWISVKDFGAVGDGTTDDTTAVHEAFTYCIANKCTLLVPLGVYRVTSGFTNSTSGGDLNIVGMGQAYSASTASLAGGACFKLDNANVASFFYLQSASNELTVQGMRFACAQTVTDRKFFRTNASSVKQNFNDVHFVSVEQPFVWEVGTYTQMSYYRNIRFTNSGSFHSKAAFTANELLGTLLVIDNIDVEGTMPANTEKVVMNLSGMRMIQGRNVLIEPSIPSAGWKGLKLRHVFDLGWARRPYATFDGIYIECTGTEVQYVIYQEGGCTKYNDAYLNQTPTSTAYVGDDGLAEFNGIGLVSASTYQLQQLFTLGDAQSTIVLRNLQSSNYGTGVTNPQIVIENGSRGSGDPGASFDNKGSQIMWEFDGGFFDAGKVATVVSSGTTLPSTDATRGRKLVFTADGSGNLNTLVQARLRGLVSAATQVWIAIRLKLPTFTSGTIEIPFFVNSVSIGGGAVYTTADSNTEKWLIMPATVITAGATLAGFGVQGTIGGVVGNLEMHYAAIGIGRSLPHIVIPNYPGIVQTQSSAAPATGTWAQGDICHNTVPAVGSPKRWLCTVAGTPGTWVSEGNL